MGRAILSGMLNAGLVDDSQTLVADASSEQVERIAQQTHARAAQSNAALVEAADIVIIATKPFHVAAVCEEIRPQATPGKLFVTICAGIPTRFIEERLGGQTRVVRVMPNTPALIGQGAAGIAPGAHATQQDLQHVSRIFDAVGKAVVVEEDKLDLVTGLTGSGPAYVFYFMEALIEAGVEMGLSPEAARTLVLQMVYGSARMALQSDKSLAELRQAVTTKGGTTEAGLRQLAEGDFFELIRQCVERATQRSKELSQG
jgi:pyrroline-5-carboxylate reductase